MKDTIAKARELCGCTHCVGGYEIGAHTLAMNVANADAQRPTSCVAAVVLTELLKDKP